MRVFIVCLGLALFCGCDPTGERRLQIPLLPANRGHSVNEQIGIAERIADQMAQHHGWIRDPVSASDRASGILRLYTIHLGDFTMHCQLLHTHGAVQLYFKDWTSLREANEAYRRMDEFDRKFHQAVGTTKDLTKR